MASPGKGTEQSSLASAASDQIRAIIEAAEQTAEQIRSEAEQDAARIRRDAEEEASGIRSEAQGDVEALLDSIRQGMASVTADLEQLHDRLQPTAPPPPPEPEQPPAPPPEPEQPPAPPPAPEPASGDTAAGDDSDIESARLVALNMALDGTSREEVDRYLSENFALSDRKALLDEVYALAGG